MQKLAATNKTIDNGTRTALYLTHVWLVFEKELDKIKHIIYSL